MGNQQERLEKEISWFAGFFEGEGHISLCKGGHTSQKQRGNLRYVPCAGLCNTDYDLLKDVKMILDTCGVSYCLHESRINGIGKKPKWEIDFKGMKKMWSFCLWIKPYMKGQKKHRCERILDFCQLRFIKLADNHQAPYGIEEENIYQELYTFKGKVPSKILNDFTSCAV